MLPGRAALLPPGQTLYDVTFGSGIFVAVGANGTIVSSIGGDPWTLRSSGIATDLRAVGNGGGVFVAAGENGTLLSSADSVTWTVRSVSAVLSSPRIAYGNGRFVVGGKGSAGFWTMLVSSNGVDWASVSVEAAGPPFSPGLPFAGVTFNAGKFLAAGGVQGANLFLTSTNGLAWKEQGTVGTFGAAKGPVFSGNGLFGAVVEWYYNDEGGRYQTLLLSEDGLNWGLPGPGVGVVRAVAAADCKFVLASGYTSTVPSAIGASYGGLNWFPVPGNTNVINALTYGNGMFVGVGDDIVPLVIPPSLGGQFPISPESNSVPVYGYAYFTAGAACLDPPVHYQWRFNGADVPGATNTYLFLSNVTTNQAGPYTVLASNAAGLMATSIVATLTVIEPVPEAPLIGSPTTDVTNYFPLGLDAFLSVSVSAWPPPVYQWRLEGNDIPGATNSFLTLYNFAGNAAGNYTLMVSNASGRVVSPVITAMVGGGTPPSIQFPPASLVVAEGARVHLSPNYSYGPTSPREFYYAWKDGTNLTLPLESFQPYFTFRQVALSDAGLYSIVVSNSFGSVTGLIASLTVVPGGPLDRWTQRNPLPQSDALLDVAPGAGGFVAVGQRGAVVSSADGTNWLSHSLRTEADLSGVAFGNSLFVAVGGRNILTSMDGVNWTTRLTRGDLTLQSTAFGNGRFVVAGGDTILSSVNGLNWTDAVLTATVSREFRGLAFGSGRFVAVSAGFGYRPAIWTSDDASNWSPLSSGPTAELESVTFGNGQFVAVGNGGNIFTSPDGLTWTSRISGVSSRLLGVAFGNGKYVVVGTRGRVLSSANGAAWATGNSGTPDRLESVAFLNGVFVAVGENGTTLSSVNGSTWFKRSQGATRDLDGITLGGGLIVVAGKAGTILTSSNGVDYVEQTTGVTNDLHGVAWNDGLYVAVGEPGAIITSPNAVQWTARPTGSSSSLKSVVWGGGRWIAMGTEGQILTSTDGASWAPLPSPTGNDLNSVAYGNGLFVAVGDNLPPNGTLLTSPDGLTWTRRNQYIGKNLRSVTFANNMFMAPANDELILVSTNGTDWESRFLSFYGYYGSNLRSATYAAGVWVVTGNEGLVITSSNSLDWVAHPLQTIENLHGVVYLNGRFVAMGNRGTILQSDYFARPAHLAGRATPDGFELSLSGQVGISYQVQASDQLPASPWTTLGSVTLTQSTTNLLDTTANNLGQRFYRAVVSP